MLSQKAGCALPASNAAAETIFLAWAGWTPLPPLAALLIYWTNIIFLSSSSSFSSWRVPPSRASCPASTTGWHNKKLTTNFEFWKSILQHFGRAENQKHDKCCWDILYTNEHKIKTKPILLLVGHYLHLQLFAIVDELNQHISWGVSGDILYGPKTSRRSPWHHRCRSLSTQRHILDLSPPPPHPVGPTTKQDLPMYCNSCDAKCDFCYIWNGIYLFLTCGEAAKS